MSVESINLYFILYQAFECVRALSKTRFAGPQSKLLFSSVLKAETVHAKTKNLLESLPPGNDSIKSSLKIVLIVSPTNCNSVFTQFRIIEIWKREVILTKLITNFNVNFLRFGQICGQQLLVLVWHSNQFGSVQKRRSLVHRQLGREDMEGVVVG